MRLKSKYRANQRGNFTVEFAVIGIVFSFLLVFSGDVIVKLSIKGKLDRLSYSLVNVLKERTQLYGEDYEITGGEARALYNIAENSLVRTLSSYESARFGAFVEEQTFRDIDQPNRLNTFSIGTRRCAVERSLAQLTDLSVVTSWGRQATLYRVTFCYETNNWIGDLLGEDFTTVNSSSVMIGR